MYGKVDMVKLLLDKHIDISLKDQEGSTVLEMLGKFTSARYEPIKALIRGKCSYLSQPNSINTSALYIPIQYRYVLGIISTIRHVNVNKSNIYYVTIGSTIIV